MINEALHTFVAGQQPALEDILRRVVREELAHYKPAEPDSTE
jgi:hypothetical protein